MLTAEELERLLQSTMYHSSFDDDSDGDQEGETSLPLCLPTPILLVGDDDLEPQDDVARPLPLSMAHASRTKEGPLTVEDNEAASQSENNISDSPTTLQMAGPPTPPVYTPADITRVAAEVDCCSAIEKTKVKTVMCLNYMHCRRCRFGAHCAFAHGADELRQPPPEMMAKKQAIVSSSTLLLTTTPPPSYIEALTAPPVELPELGATPAYEDAVREHREHLPPPPPTDALSSTLAETAMSAAEAVGAFNGVPTLSSKRNAAFPTRQRGQASGGNVRTVKSQPRRLNRSPV